jgi:Transposase DDE domain
MTRLGTNLPRTPFSLDLVARLYRLRWQIELVFKEWKSYANLHKFDTANEHIAAGLIWASLCAAMLKRFLAHAAQFVGGTPISTCRVAMCASHVIDEIVTALLACLGLAVAFRDGITFLLANARRSHPRRDRKTGRLQARLVVVGERSSVITYETRVWTRWISSSARSRSAIISCSSSAARHSTSPLGRHTPLRPHEAMPPVVPA